MAEAPILYVEDEEDYQLLVVRILARSGLRVLVAGSGQEGRELLRRQEPRLVLLDINLPDTDGYALCQAIRLDPVRAELPVLMLSVRRRPEEWLRGFSSGATDYISKPINPSQLLERVGHALREKPPARREGTAPEYRLIQAAVSGNCRSCPGMCWARF